ncbi:MAG: ribokinase [Terriglobales bacterium]|jgi:ribokinase
MKRILVIGSANVDMVMGLPRLPLKGETVTDGVFLQTFGGKGANQAVAAKRSGGEVSFLSCLGNDDHGNAIERALSADGIDLSWTVRTSECATGSALVMYDKDGANYLAVAPGSNYKLEPKDIVRCVHGIADLAMIVLQYEISEAALHEAFRVANLAEVPVLFNYAPARSLKHAVVQGTNCGIVVNESEAAALSGVQVFDTVSAFQSARSLRVLGYKFAIVTLGELGACLVSDEAEAHIPAIPVTAVDSTAAGDTFCGALATSLVEGTSLLDAVRFATAAASLCVQRVGAQPSIPHKLDIDKALGTETGT